MNNFELNEQFENIYNILEKTEKNVFVTGRAGTGKSTLLRYFRDNTLKNVVVLAPTGVAAVNIQGQTIHSFFRFKPDVTTETVPLIKIHKSKKKIYQNIDAIIIDEISMVRADLLDCINAFLRIHGPSKNKPFGAIQMIFFGDLYQLPPVVTPAEKEIFNGHYQSPYFFDAKCYKDVEVECMQIDHVYRQKDEDFIRMLNHIRNRTISSDDLRKLNQRCLNNFDPSLEDFYVYLTTTNKMADEINKQRLQELKTRPYCFEGMIEGDFKENNLPTNSVLDLKYGAQVMLLNNDYQGRWVNGSIGKIVSVARGEDGGDIVNVELLDGQRVEVKPFTWEMFKFYYDEENKAIESELIGAFTQYPLKLAWAVTIHKSQGKTFSKVIIDIGRGAFAFGQVYVALSRCTRLDGIILKKPILKKHILMDPRVVEFINGQTLTNP